jgi:hypothetical protein
MPIWHNDSPISIGGASTYSAAMTSKFRQQAEVRVITLNMHSVAVMPKVEEVILWNRSSACIFADPVLLFDNYAD